MRGVILILLIVYGCFGCSTYTGKPTKWDYMTPEHTTCYGKEIKFCRKYGAHLICECIV